MLPPLAAAGRAHQAQADIGAIPWLVRQLRFGLQLPWNRRPRNIRALEYNLSPEDLVFACGQVRRWIEAGYYREASVADLRAMRHARSLSQAFVTASATKSRLVIYYSLVNECWGERSFSTCRPLSLPSSPTTASSRRTYAMRTTICCGGPRINSTWHSAWAA
jgi:hypothetical protein